MQTTAAAARPDPVQSLRQRATGASATTAQGSSSPVATGTTRANVSLPNIGGRGQAYALAAREAGRLHAASISEDEYQDLLRERQTLLDKKYSAGLSRKERSRFEYIGWSIDTIDDARHGFILDALESAVAQYAQLAEDIRSLKDQLERPAPK